MKEILKTNVIANLTIDFASTEFKNLDIFINGRSVHFADSDQEYDMPIDSYLRLDTNAIKLVPVTRDIDIIALSVDIQERDD